MTDGLDVKIEGVDALIGKLEAVKQDIRYRGGRAALRKAAMLIVDAAKQNAARINDPKTAEDISANIALRWNGRLFKQTGNLGFRIGVLGGARSYADTRENRRKGRVGASYKTDGEKTNPGGDTWYWRLVELGTQKTRAQPFLRPAATQAAGAAIEEFMRQYSKSMERAIRRAAKKSAGGK